MNNMEKTKPEKPAEIEKQENGVADQQQRTRKIDENRIESVEIRVGTEKTKQKNMHKNSGNWQTSWMKLADWMKVKTLNQKM